MRMISSNQYLKNWTWTEKHSENPSLSNLSPLSNSLDNIVRVKLQFEFFLLTFDTNVNCPQNETHT